MKCLLVFDQLNDVLYTKCNRKFLKHALKLAQDQGLVAEDDGSASPKLSSNVIIQLFSPIITSQRLMSCQFGNSYTSIQCEDGTSLAFKEYMGYLFVYISELSVAKMNRLLGVCIFLVKHLCGPNVPLLKSSKEKCVLLSMLLDSWQLLQDTDQAMLVEAVEQLMVNNELSSATMRALQEAVSKLQQDTEFTKIHALVLVENKFLSLYSSRGTEDLLPGDVMFLGLLAECFKAGQQENYVDSESDTSASSAGCIEMASYPSKSSVVFDNSKTDMQSYLLLMSESRPHAVHVGQLSDGVYLVLLFQTGNISVSLGLYDAFRALNALQGMQMLKDIANVKHAFDILDTGMKKTLDAVKRLLYIPAVDASVKKVAPMWGLLKVKFVEFIRNPGPECVMRIESGMVALMDNLKSLFLVTSLDETVLLENRSVVEGVYNKVKTNLKDFSDFLKVKALRNFTLGSRASLTINKYLEEFPGLVHFMYIDRNLHRLTAPSLDFHSEETTLLTKKKIWFMVEFARSHLQEGHLSMMWKDTTFNYAYFLWFEDSSGSPLKPKIYPTSVIRDLPTVGVLMDDFYKRLVEACFPKLSSHKVQCYELFCIHLGLATSSCVLEHSRRLAATIWEVTGIPNNPTDFL